MERPNPRERLLPLMFEMGRLLKSEITRNGESVVSFLHLETLRFIQERENPTMSDVADYLKIAPPSATALVNGLFKEGIIERTADPTDRRIVRLSLSVKGKDFIKQAMRQREKAFAQVTASLSIKDCKELVRILKIITQKSLPPTK